MDIVLLFSLILISIITISLYFSRKILYMGVFGALIFLFLGLIFSSGEEITQHMSFSELINETTLNNETIYKYGETNHDIILNIDSNFKLMFSTLLIIIGSFLFFTFKVDG